MTEYNEEYDRQLRQLVEENKHGYHGKLRRCRELKHLDDYVFERT